jgi:hypothetical protein
MTLSPGAEGEEKEEAGVKKKAEEEAAAKRKTEEEAAAKTKAEQQAAAKKTAEERAAALKKAEEEALPGLILGALNGNAAPVGKAAKLRAIVKAGSYGLSFTAPTSGGLVVSWYVVPKGAHVSSKPQPVLVASGRATFTAAGTLKVTVRLTRKGQRLLSGAKSVKLTSTATFTATGKAPIRAIRTFVLRR